MVSGFCRFASGTKQVMLLMWHWITMSFVGSSGARGWATWINNESDVRCIDEMVPNPDICVPCSSGSVMLYSPICQPHEQGMLTTVSNLHRVFVHIIKFLCRRIWVRAYSCLNGKRRSVKLSVRPQTITIVNRGRPYNLHYRHRLVRGRRPLWRDVWICPLPFLVRTMFGDILQCRYKK